MSKQGKTNYVTQQQLKTIRGGSGIGHIHANKDVLDSITAQDLQAWSSAAENSHEHDNKDVLDLITEETLQVLGEVVAMAHSHSNRNAIDLFRYDSESNTIIIGTENNRVNFAAYGNVAAGGPRTGSGGGGLIQAVYGYGDLSGTFSDSDKNETFNAYTTARLAARIKQLEDTTPNVEWETTGSDYVSLSVNGASKNLLTAHQSVSNIENAIRSLQSQLDSVASRTGFGELTAFSLEVWDEVVAMAHSHSNRNAIDLFRYDSETNTIIIGTADNRVNFAAYGNVAAGGPRTGSGGGGLIQTVYGYGDLSGTFSDSDKNETFNAYTTARLAARIKQLEDSTPNVEWGTAGSDYVSLSVNGASKNLLTAHQSVSNIENAIRSLQSQIDSVASRTGFDELTASSLFTETMAAENIYGTLHGDADTVDNEHASAFAHVGAHNNLMASGNEFTFASSGFSGAAYINYRTAGGTNGSISDYYFCDGAGTTLWAMSTVANQAHNGQTAYDGFTAVSQALQSLQSQVLSSSSRDNAELEILEAVMSESLHSLQSQIDSLATRTGTEEIITTTLHADTLTAGNARLSGNSYAQGEVTAGSDERWKEHIQDISADIIDRLVPCEWDWREGHGEGHSAGLIAQQVLKVLPFAVKGDAASGYMLNYNVFHAYEIKELQRLRKRVAELREIINNLKS